MGLDVKLNRFEEIIVNRDREKYFIENIEQIVEEETGCWKKYKSYLHKFRKF